MTTVTGKDSKEFAGDNIERLCTGGYPTAEGGELEDGLSGEDEGDHTPHPFQLHLHLQLHLVELTIISMLIDPTNSNTD